MSEGFFLTLEGPEGGGKTTQARRLAGRLIESGLDVTLAREPGGTSVGERIRELVLDPELEPGPLARTEALLFCAARAELVARVIRPALAEGAVVICDRYMDATVAYQGYGGGLDVEALRGVIDFATGGLIPDLTLLLDLATDVGLARRRADGEWNRLDEAETAYHERVRRGYRSICDDAPARWRVIDASRSEDLVARDIWSEVSQVLALDAATSALTE